MTDWLGGIIVTVIVLIGLGIFYRALREPLNIVFHWIGIAFMAIWNALSGLGGAVPKSGGQTIEYG